MHQELFRDACVEASNVLLAAAAKEFQAPLTFELDCQYLTGYYVNHDIRVPKNCQHPSLARLFRKVNELTGPIIYYFELADQTDRALIVAAIRQGEITSRRHFPTLKPYPTLLTNTLYVGKVEKNLTGRLVTHLGYNRTAGTQGLQLYYWAAQLGLPLRLHLYRFNEQMSPLLAFLETALAQHLRPLVGKHR